MNPANIIRYGTKIIDNLSYTEGTLTLRDGNDYSNWYKISISLPHSTESAFWYLYIYYSSLHSCRQVQITIYNYMHK